jgi:hypothetical protein
VMHSADMPMIHPTARWSSGAQQLSPKVHCLVAAVDVHDLYELLCAC